MMRNAGRVLVWVIAWMGVCGGGPGARRRKPS